MGGKQGSKHSNKMSDDENSENYAVERIVEDRVIKGKVQYKVHWEGYGTDEETWENESQLDCPELLEEYIANQQNNEETVVESSSKPAKRKGSRGKKATREEPTKVEEEPTTEPAVSTEYEVEKIVDVRDLNGKTQYKVHWRGYTSDEETWENESQINSPDLVKKYLKEKETGKHNGNESTKKPSKKKAKVERPAPQGDNSEFEVERILEMHTFKNGDRKFLVKWVGFSKRECTWEPEDHLVGTDILEKFLLKVEKAKELPAKELRLNRRPTDRFTAMPQGDKRRQSKRHANKQRIKYYDAE